MTATNQHDLHPAAESLSAFAEQALGERERTQILEHLAACARCRRIIALAQEAAEPEVLPAAAAASSKSTPWLWWRHWWLTAAPVGAMAMMMLAVVLYVRHTNTQMARNTPMAAMQAETSAFSPAVATQPAPAASAHSEKKDMRATGGAGVPNEPAKQRARNIAMQAPREAEAPPAGVINLQQLESKSAQADNQAAAPAPLPDAYQRAQKQLAEEQRQLQATAVERHLLAAKASPGDRGGSGGTAPSANEPAMAASAQVTVSAAAPAVETESLAAGVPAGFGKQKSTGFAATRIAHIVQLPGGLHATSLASVGDRTVALDKNGALYCSSDRGTTWTVVLPQWTGRAVAVRTMAEDNKTAGGAGNPAPESAPRQFFEILNDKNQVWLSTDGITWTPK